MPALPGAPSNLTATAVRANGNNDTVTLKWTDNATNEAAFEVQRSTSATFSGPTTQTAPANATQLVQTGLARTRAYYYRVRATNPGGGVGLVGRGRRDDPVAHQGGSRPLPPATGPRAGRRRRSRFRGRFAARRPVRRRDVRGSPPARPAIRSPDDRRGRLSDRRSGARRPRRRR